MHGILAAASAAATSTASAADGTIVVIAVAGVWMYALGRKGAKGTIPGRLAAVTAFGIGAWLLLGASDAPGAMAVASGTLRGLSAVLSAIGTVLKAA